MDKPTSTSFTKRQPLLSDDFEIPSSGRIAEYSLHPITTKETVEDWLVIKSNADAIALQRGIGTRKDWPFNCTLEENYKDLAWLELCAKYRQLFCYVMRSVRSNEYVGALYLYPIEFQFPELSDDFTLDLSFWITQSEYDKGIYPSVHAEILSWCVSQWPFDAHKIYYRNLIDPDQNGFRNSQK